MVKKWIQKVCCAKDRKGALHRQLGYPEDEKIPKGVLKRICGQGVGSKVVVRGEKVAVTTLLKQRVNFALNVGYGRFKRK